MTATTSSPNIMDPSHRLLHHWLAGPCHASNNRFPKPTSASGAQAKPLQLIDPFLAQYIKPTSGSNHEIYFTSLDKQVRIKSFEYYQKYLNHKVDPELDTSLASTTSPPRVTPYTKRPVSDLGAHDNSEAQQPSRRKLKEATERPKLGLIAKVPHTEVAVEVLPAKFEESPMGAVIELVSRMINSLISLNDKSVPPLISSPTNMLPNEPDTEEKKKLLTRYHSRTPPAISIHTYIGRLAKFNNFTPATMLTTIYYIDLLSHNFQPYFTLNLWTVHRFLLVATMLAQKSLEDFFFTNDHYARVGGVALTELNYLELDFLTRVNWKVIPAKQILETETSIKYSKEVLEIYYWQLITLMGNNASDQSNIIYKLPSEASA